MKWPLQAHVLEHQCTNSTAKEGVKPFGGAPHLEGHGASIEDLYFGPTPSSCSSS